MTLYRFLLTQTLHFFFEIRLILISDFEEASFLFNFRLLDLMGSLLHQLDALCSYCIRLQFRISPRGLGSLYLFFLKLTEYGCVTIYFLVFTAQELPHKRLPLMRMISHQE